MTTLKNLEIIIALNEWKNSELPLEYFLLLKCLHDKDLQKAKYIHEHIFAPTEQQALEHIDPAVHIIKSLEFQGWIKIAGNNWPEDLEVRQKFINFVKNSTNAVDQVETWIQDWRDIFPDASTTGNRSYPPKGDKAGCLKKMRAFVRNHGKEFDKEVIFNATKAYIEDRKRERWSFLKQAHYFIEKDGSSSLYQWCEVISKKGNNFPKPPTVGQEAY